MNALCVVCRADRFSVDLSWKMKKQMMLDVATGMQYLHCQNPVIIHRDLKSLNVLIDENWVTKVQKTLMVINSVLNATLW